MSHPVRQFRGIVDRYLEANWQLFPEDASEAGLHQFDAELGENGAASWKKYVRLATDALREVEALPDHEFTGDDWLDRRLFLSMVRTTVLSHGTFEHWRRNPQIHADAAVNSVFHLVIRNADRLAKIRPAIESRLAKIPRFLAAGASALHRPIPLWTKLAGESCKHVGSFFNNLADQLAPLSPDPARTRRLATDAIAAFAKFAAAAQSKTPGPAGGFAIGREAFEFLIRERTALPYSVAEARAIGENLVARLSAELAAEAKKFGRKSASQIIEAATANWAPSGALLAEYQHVTTEVRGQFERAEVVTFPKDERCKVTPVPAFLQHLFPTAAYSQPGAFDRDQTGIFWVNDAGARYTDPARRAAEVRQHFGLEFTCAHEAYPGHHLQFVVQNQHASRLRRLASHAIFYEGWTLWCEKMSVDRGIIDLPEARLIQLHDALWRAHRIVIDCGLHDGTLTYAAACRRLQDGVGFTAARARGDVNWYTSAPTVPMSYLLGRLEVERLHAQLVGREGWSLRQFNDWLLSHGAIPLRWIWEARLRPAAKK